MFGSAARGVDFTDESDIDLLVEFEGDGAPSIGSFSDLRDALADLLGRRVDLVMGRAIRNPYLRAEN